MKALRYIIFFLLIAFIGCSIYIAIQPNSYEVERSHTINAPVSVVYNNVIDFKNWEAWNSWKEENPEIEIILSDKTDGVGGSYSWKEDGDIGIMKTIFATANDSIAQDMQFSDYPKSDVIWKFLPNEDGTTTVNWRISGKDLPFGFKAFITFMGGMDKQIGPYYERSLEMLDSIVVNSMKAYDIKIDGITEYGGGFYMYKTTSATSSNISQVMGKQYGEIMNYMAKNNIIQSGMPLTIYNEMNDANGNIIMSQGIPIQNKMEVTNDSEILCGYIPKTKVLKTTLKGNYTNLPKAWKNAMNYLAKNYLEQSNVKPFEIYQSDPGNYPNPADWITEVYIPIK